MTNLKPDFVLGIDVGTSGARTMAATAQGEVRAEAHLPIADSLSDGVRHEQDPQDWWRAVCATVRRVLTTLGAGARQAISGVAVTSTSGSLVLADSLGEPVRHAILYDDARGLTAARDLNERLPHATGEFNPSFSLIKALWVRREEAEAWKRSRYLLHPADWLTAKLTGQFGISDESDALKLGYDSEARKWGPAVALAGIPSEMLPRVVQSGEPIGHVSNTAAEETGLLPGTPVLAGATDGIASLVASGASEPGHANTTLGTTLVWKVLSLSKPQLTAGMYCHRHPSGLWAPGAASNAGPGSLRTEGLDLTPAELDRMAAGHLPSAHICYLLRSKGERFPFLSSEAVTFFETQSSIPMESHAAQLQSLAFVERWGYERLQENGVAVGSEVFSTGSAAGSTVFSQLRANVLGRDIILCRHPNSAFGAAVLAASATLFAGDLKSAIRGMTRVSARYSPRSELAARYNSLYAAFRSACARHGYA